MQTIKIHGRDYVTVSERLKHFRKNYPGWQLDANIVPELTNFEVVTFKAMVINDLGIVVATGHAQEVKGSSNINKTSHLENCETSAWGRALANLFCDGEEVASADEVRSALLSLTDPATTEQLNYIEILKGQTTLDISALDELESELSGKISSIRATEIISLLEMNKDTTTPDLSTQKAINKTLDEKGY